jgi:coenzyme F420-dependent glucose-6-phosphate dehydrogenase
MKFGYKASAEQFDPRSLLEYSVLAEQLGFDSVFISDHLQPWRHTGGHARMRWQGSPRSASGLTAPRSAPVF